MTMIASTRVHTALLAVATLTLMACSKAPPCPARFDANTPAECSCAGGEKGTVWGSGIYTTDSPVCVAAVHAGAIGSGGGTVKPKAAAGCPGYVGSTANGVTTSNWGSFGGSFVFPGKEAACAAAPPAPTAPPVAAGVAQGGACPATLAGFADFASLNEFTCSCAPGGRGAVYGTGIFTADSSLCAAAAMVGHPGANVKFKKAPGCPKYTGSSSNGVTSTSWGEYGASFFVEGMGDGKCQP